MGEDEKQKEREVLWERLLQSDKQNEVIQLPAMYLEKRWDAVRTLGGGAFGEVRLFKDSEKPESLVAVKCLDMIGIGNVDEVFVKLRREALIMRVLIHCKHVIRYMGMRYDGGQIQMFLEYADGGELFDVIEPDKGMPVRKAQNFFRQLIAGVKFIHSMGVAHRDLKPENLLLTKKDQLKICDFGFATIFRYRGTERKLKARCGTRQYVSPQVMMGEYSGDKADIWSCGIVLVTMLTGELPWLQPVRAAEPFKYWVFGSHWRTLPPWDRLIFSTADTPRPLSLLRRMLDENEDRRIKISDIEKHEFIVKDVFDELIWIPQRCSQLEGEENPASVQPFVSTPINIPRSSTTVAKSKMPSQQSSDAHQSPPDQKKRKILPASDAAFAQKSRAVTRPVSQPNSRYVSQAIRECRLYALTGNFFSQPVGMELLTQLDYSASQHPLALFARRMTRFCVTVGAAETMTLIKDRLDFKFTCVRRAPNMMSISGPGNQMVYVITIYEMMGNEGRKVMVDCRRSRGDGIEFKRAFLDLRKKLSDICCVMGNQWLEKQGLVPAR